MDVPNLFVPLTEHEISYVPHFHTLTESGKSHFSRSADGLAEFIDNSIQACKDVKPARNIGISFFLVGEGGYLLMTDNGCGMCLDNLKAFATFSLDRETRGLRAGEADHSSISKFGVGAKQAGFFLGNRLRVSTKMANSNIVLDFAQDEEKFSARYEAGQDVYKDKIQGRSVGDSFASAPDDERAIPPLMEAIRLHESQYDQFTMIIIRLNSDTVHPLMQVDRAVEVSEELAAIYHFHLHPEHTPQGIADLRQFAGFNGGTLKKVNMCVFKALLTSSVLHFYNRY
jgi:hypothetical protein